MPDLVSPSFTRALLLGLLCLGVQTSQAAEVLIKARVEKDKVVDLTTPSISCGTWKMCNVSRTVDVPFEYSKTVNLASTDDRDKVYAHLPSRQNVFLINRSTQETATATLGFGYISQKVTYQTQRIVTPGVKGCSAPQGTLGGEGYVKFLWSTYYTDAQQPCVATASGTEEPQHSDASDFMLSYFAGFPTASSLSPGLWEGYIDYPIGGGSGFDFGNLTRMSANTIRFRIELDVVHDMQVEMPASGGRIEVVPPGGWKPWENTNAIPPRLFHDTPLKVWASSPFAVYVICQYGAGADYCSLFNRPANDMTPVYMALTLPAAFSYNGQPVTRLPLGVGAANAKVLSPAGNVSSQPGHVHFDVQQAEVRKMLANYRGASYEGNVTVVFDANP